MSELILEIVEGPQAGRQIPLEHPLVIGRAQDAPLRLDDPQVSRSHARITPQGRQAIVEDLGSSNGTFVNGNELHAPAIVDPDDQVLIGVTVLQVRTPQQIAVQPSAVQPVPAAILAQPAAAPPPPRTPAFGSPQPRPGAYPSTPAAGSPQPAHGIPATGHHQPAQPAAVPAAPLAPIPQAPSEDELGEDLASLLDQKVKRRAQFAPLALFALVVLVVIIYLAAK